MRSISLGQELYFELSLTFPGGLGAEIVFLGHHSGGQILNFAVTRKITLLSTQVVSISLEKDNTFNLRHF